MKRIKVFISSVQIMLFKDRLEVSNPGSLPYGLSPAKLRLPHSSIPANPLLAESMYLNGFIEKVGTGTGDIIRLCDEIGLRAPDFIQEEDFKTIIWRTLDNEVNIDNTPQVSGQATEQVSGQVSGQVNGELNGGLSGELSGEVSGEVTEEVKRVVIVLRKNMKRSEIQSLLQLKHDDYFRINYINPAIELGMIELLFPDIPNHPNQKYKLTTQGKKLQIFLQKKKKNG
ncbi:MAG: ATP-binding protein [Bacteroidales bacterium]|nr:ATP-binding protein [Bacteroidales bacterium]